MFPRPAVDLSGSGAASWGNGYGRWRSRVRGLPEFLGAHASAAGRRAVARRLFT